MLNLRILFLLTPLCLFFISCEKSEPPPNVRVAEFKGTPYERGFQHGEQFADDIRSLYARLLENALLPYLNLERANIAPVLGRYYDEKYDNGNFSYLMLLESGKHLWENGHIPEKYMQEIQGLADGSGIAFDKILLMNTFMDTMMAFRGVSLFIQSIQKPHLTDIGFARASLIEQLEASGQAAESEEEASLGVVAGLNDDGIDNDDDGETDEADEGRIEYEPSMNAMMLEVPTDATIQVALYDEMLGGDACVDAGNVEPIGERVARRECVMDECITPGCEGKELLDVDCLQGPESTCLDRNITRECFDPDCLQPLDPGCIEMETLRLQLNDRLFVYADDADKQYFEIEYIKEELDEEDPVYRHTLDCKGTYVVRFTPPEPLPEASVASVVLQVQDMSAYYTPAPFHARSMRDERFVFTTKGYAQANEGKGAHLFDVPNMGFPDGTRPPTFSFAAKDTATTDGDPLLAHHYILVDSDVMHEHTLLAIHNPTDGLKHVTLGWTGLIWGFSGMNEKGLAYSVNNSDTLDSPMVGNVIESIIANILEILSQPDLGGLAMILDDVILTVEGRPLGLMGREILETAETVEDGLAYLHSVRQTFGWNILLADATGGLAGVELDAATQMEDFVEGVTDYAERDGFFYYTGDENDAVSLDENGALYASLKGDDLRMGSHFIKNTNDMQVWLDTFSPRPQRKWSSYYIRSVRAYHVLGEKMKARYGRLDVEAAIEILREEDLVDEKDSMNAVVFEPAKGRIHYGMGCVPAVKNEFRLFEF